MSQDISLKKKKKLFNIIINSLQFRHLTNQEKKKKKQTYTSNETTTPLKDG